MQFPKKCEELGQVVRANMTCVTISCLKANDAVLKPCFLVHIRLNRLCKLSLRDILVKITKGLRRVKEHQY